MSILVSPDRTELTYMGRTELYKGFPRFVFAGTSVTVRFKGTSVRCIIVNHKFFNIQEIGFVLDGETRKVRFEQSENDITLTLAEDLADSVHTLTLYKRQDAAHYFEFKGFLLNDGAEVLPADPLPRRRIECYGDSVSAGAVTEATDHVASPDPEGHEGVFDNAWYSFPMITARNLGAAINNIAQGGISVYDRTGWYHAPDFIGMETAYDKVCYFPEAEGGYTEWDFSKYIPHAVIFAVGQNDAHNAEKGDPDINDPAFREYWKDGYKRIIRSLRGHYPKALIILTLTVLCHDSGWDDAIDEIARELADSRIKHFRFTRTGAATPGHPRISEQYEMAEELTRFISNTEGVWED
ncbi:MAG: electron transporter RnfD [Ruminococcus sp.]|nr:electron transporter RnfD [Ruminococcus sp.]